MVENSWVEKSGIEYLKIVKIFQNAYLQVAVSCLEQLHVRELYGILPIEEWCQELLKNGDKSFYEDISKAVQDVFDSKPSLHLEDKIRSVFKFRKNFRQADIRLFIKYVDQFLDHPFKTGNFSRF